MYVFQKDRVRSLGTGVTDGCEWPCGCWELETHELCKSNWCSYRRTISLAPAPHLHSSVLWGTGTWVDSISESFKSIVTSQLSFLVLTFSVFIDLTSGVIDPLRWQLLSLSFLFSCSSVDWASMCSLNLLICLSPRLEPWALTVVFLSHSFLRVEKANDLRSFFFPLPCYGSLCCPT